MSEEHDAECNDRVELNEEESSHQVDLDVIDAEKTDEPSANNNVEEDSAIKNENSNDIVDEKEELHSANDKTVLEWTLEGAIFKISWRLPEEHVSSEDYVALCYAGKTSFLCY